MTFLRRLVVAVLVVAPVALAQSLSAPQQFYNLGDLKLESGKVIRDCNLGYRTLGTLNADRSNAVLFPTWFSGSSDDLLRVIGPTQFFDTTPYFVILLDAIGNGISCSPSNGKTQHGTKFPEFTIRDMVESEHRLVTEKFGLQHVRAVMGQSMGGMQTFQWLISYPGFMDVAIPIVGSPRLTSYDMMLWRAEEEALLEDPGYQGGNYTVAPKMKTVMLLHSINLTTPEFRVATTSPAEFEKFFAETEAGASKTFDANDWRWQMHAMLAQDIAPGALLKSAAAKIEARVLVINSKQDHMVNPTPALTLAPLIHAQTIVLDGMCGHIAPGCEVDKIHPAIEAALALRP